MAKYQLNQMRNRLNPDKDGLWHATPAPAQKFDTDDLCRLASRHTTLAPFEVRAVLDLISDFVPQALAEGRVVQLGGLGSLRLEYGSEGVREPEYFHPRLMRPARVVFRPSRQLMQEVRAALFYEPGGIVAEGTAFASVESYRRWQAGRQEGAGGEP